MLQHPIYLLLTSIYYYYSIMIDIIRPAKNHFHRLKAVGASAYYGWPSKQMKVIGVTGTDGKTTTTHLIHHILEVAGHRSSMLSTIYAKIGSQIHETGLHVTTPDAILVQRMLGKAVRAGDEYFVLETTSHGLHQNRNWGIHYDVSMITNITHEHLDYHKTYDNYAATKAKLLAQSRIGIINRDDDSYGFLSDFCKHNNIHFKTYGLEHKSDYTFDARAVDGLDLTDYNVYNYMGAYGVCRELGIDEHMIRKAMKTYQLPRGRLEIAYNGMYDVLVDFAHTPHSIQALLSSMRKRVKGRIIHVFGSAGQRDHAKRPLMGEASAQYSDIVILTEEDHRSEDPQEIAQQIRDGMGSKFAVVDARDANVARAPFVTTVIDRAQAIELAVSLAHSGDMVICTGKSHEKSLCRGHREHEWDEFEAVKRAVEARKHR